MHFVLLGDAPSDCQPHGIALAQCGGCVPLLVGGVFGVKKAGMKEGHDPGDGDHKHQ